jgi:CRISPR-associated protein (TIGR03984 family)
MEGNLLSDSWLQGKLPEVSSSGIATVFVQGYPSTGFGRVTEDSVEWRLSPEGSVFDAQYSFDVRLFGDLGEYHRWCLGKNQWNDRLAKVDDERWSWRAPDRKFVLWGSSERTENGWTYLTEQRGIKLWAPIEAQHKKHISLPVWERIEAEEDTGVVYIKDAILRPLEVE